MQFQHVGYGNLVGSRGGETGRTSSRAAIIVNAFKRFYWEADHRHNGLEGYRKRVVLSIFKMVNLRACLYATGNESVEMEKIMI